MEKKRFSEKQIIRILREGDTAGNVPEVCRQHNVTEQMFYRWREKYAGIGAEIGKLRVLEIENAKLKRKVAELTLDKQMLRDILSKMW